MDPTSYEVRYHYGRMLMAAGRLVEAGGMFESAASLRPEDYQALAFVLDLYQTAGRYEEARLAGLRGLEGAEHALTINPGDSRALTLGSTMLLRLGDEATGREWLTRALQADPRNAMVVNNAACFESLAGNVDAALDHLEHAIELGFHNAPWLQHDPDFEPLRSHPRFKELVKKAEMT